MILEITLVTSTNWVSLKPRVLVLEALQLHDKLSMIEFSGYMTLPIHSALLIVTRDCIIHGSKTQATKTVLVI